MPSALKYCYTVSPDVLTSSTAAKAALVTILKNSKEIDTFCTTYAAAEKEIADFFALTRSTKTTEAKTACAALISASVPEATVDWFMTACCLGINESADKLLGGKGHPFAHYSAVPTVPTVSKPQPTNRPTLPTSTTAPTVVLPTPPSPPHYQPKPSPVKTQPSSYSPATHQTVSQQPSKNKFGWLKWIVIIAAAAASFGLPELFDWMTYWNIAAFWGGLILLIVVYLEPYLELEDLSNFFIPFFPLAAAFLYCINNFYPRMALGLIQPLIVVAFLLNFFMRPMYLMGGFSTMLGVMLVAMILPSDVRMLLCTYATPFQLICLIGCVCYRFVIHKILD